MSLKIIGIAGTNGAGKDSVGRILAEQHGYLFVSVTDVLRAELRRRGLPVDRVHMRTLSAEWRREFGYGVLIDRAVEGYQSAMATGTYNSMAVASLRNPFEVDRIHELGGEVWWIDADARLRFDRIQRNAATRARAGEDERTFEEFLAEEVAEMHSGGDPATLDMAAVKDKCDRMLQNGGNTMDMLEEEIADLITEAVEQ